MSDPATIVITAKNLVYSLFALVVTNVLGWKLFAKSKLEEMKDHEERLRVIEKNYPGLKYLDDLIASVSDKLDSLSKSQEDQSAELNRRIDDLYHVLLRKD